jgi:hypothetical protein
MMSSIDVDLAGHSLVAAWAAATVKRPVKAATQDLKNIARSVIEFFLVCHDIEAVQAPSR